MASDPGRRGDARWDEHERQETPLERLDRNWADLLQELRVALTGVQLFTGLLLTVPFQARFDTLATHQRVLYLVAVGLSLLATALLMSPVVLHRVLFRLHLRGVLVSLAQRLALCGFAMLGLAVVGVLALIVEMVLGTTAGVVAGALAFVVFALLWASDRWWSGPAPGARVPEPQLSDPRPRPPSSAPVQDRRPPSVPRTPTGERPP